MGGIIAVVVLVAAAAAAYVIESRHNKTPGKTAAKTSSTTTTTLPPPRTVTATAASWKLPVPVRDAVGVAGPGGLMLVIGGETGTGGAADGVFSLNLTSGSLHQADALPIGVYNGPAGVIGNTVYVFGGTNGTPTASVQAFPLSPSATAGAGAKSSTSAGTHEATAAGQLPAPRAGAGVAVIGDQAYIVGGFDGATPEPSVLSTSDGRTFTTIATLPVPVRDAAVAAWGNNIYVFGGSGATASKPVAVVQEVDLTTGKANVVAHLPVPVRGASAVVLGRYIYVCGGQKAAVGIGVGTNGTIWGFDPADNRVVASGHLATAVAYAATAVVGSSAWLVAGESGGVPVASAQQLKAEVVLTPPGTPTGGTGSTVNSATAHKNKT